jgi:hypothetical protein
MWSPFPPIASLAAGMLSSTQHFFKTGHGAMTKLNYTELSTFTPYIEFARAAYCDSSKIAGWKCGNLSFIPRLDAFAVLLIVTKVPVMLFRALCRL